VVTNEKTLFFIEMRKGFDWKFWIPALFLVIVLAIIGVFVKGVVYKTLGIPVYSYGTTINVNKQ
jgi:hypothetical protein